MFKIYACKATIHPDCLISVHPDINSARIIGHQTHNVIKSLITGNRIQSYTCIKLTDADDIQIEQYGSI